MKYDFNKVIDRSKYHSVKWDELETIFGTQDVLPMWVADMEFRSPKPVIEAIKKAAEHGIYGYTSRPDSYYQAIIDWIEKRHHCSPHNPVRRVWQKEELSRLGKICLKHNLIVVSDEIHADILFKGYKHTPFASISKEFAQNSITCTAPSKTFNLAGLQTSAIIIPNKEYYGIYNNMLNSLALNENNYFGLIALEAAYKYGEEWLNQLLFYLNENLEFLIKYFKERIPKIKVIKPEGTYLVWLDCRQLGFNTKELNSFMLKKVKVALDDGNWFGSKELPAVPYLWSKD